MPASLKAYYGIAKPGMVYGNAIPFIGGFALAARGDFRPPVFLAALAGLSLVMASGCVFNNLIDRDIDAKMGRTKDRALASGRVPARSAAVYGLILGLAGFGLLASFVNLAALAAAALGFFFYVFMYSLWWKRRSPLGTAVGSVAGAMPPVVGYAAASGRIDLAAFLLFAIMAAWQMPHFFAIAIRRKDDYAAAGVPVLPLVKGVRATKRQTLVYIVAFTVLASSLTLFGYCGYAYLAVALALSLAWLALCLAGFRIPEGDARNAQWARRMFFFSLLVMIALFAAIALSAVARA